MTEIHFTIFLCTSNMRKGKQRTLPEKIKQNNALTIRCLDISSYDKFSKICSNIQSGNSSNNMTAFYFILPEIWFTSNFNLVLISKNTVSVHWMQYECMCSLRKLSLVLFLFSSSSPSSLHMTTDARSLSRAPDELGTTSREWCCVLNDCYAPSIHVRFM